MKTYPVLIIGSLLISISVQAAQSCAELLTDFDRQTTRQQFDQARGQLLKIESVCSKNNMEQAKRLYTDHLAKRANDLINHGDLEEAERLLDQSQILSWAVAAARGDLAAKYKNWKEAARQYAQAHSLLTERGHVWPGEISNQSEMEELLYKLARDAQLVYGKLDDSVTRGEKAQGILLIYSTRSSFAIRPTPLPVHFGTDQAGLDPDGIESAIALAEFLRDESLHATKAILTGFADERGTREHNQELSERRAKTVAEFLKIKGVNMLLETHGKGEMEPPKAVLDHLSQDEQLARWRRVELELVTN